MDVTFTKSPGRRYLVSVERRTGPELAPRRGPGYDPHLPHDLVHFVVEAEAGITGGVFGRLAAGDCGLSWPADPAERRRAMRHRHQPTEAERADMARSEALAAVCLPRWQVRAGHLSRLPDWIAGVSPVDPESPLVQRICVRLDEAARQWAAVPAGGSLTLTWPHPEGRRRHPAPPKRRSSTRTVRRRRGD